MDRRCSRGSRPRRARAACPRRRDSRGSSRSAAGRAGSHEPGPRKCGLAEHRRSLQPGTSARARRRARALVGIQPARKMTRGRSAFGPGSRAVSTGFGSSARRPRSKPYVPGAFGVSASGAGDAKRRLRRSSRDPRAIVPDRGAVDLRDSLRCTRPGDRNPDRGDRRHVLRRSGVAHPDDHRRSRQSLEGRCRSSAGSRSRGRRPRRACRSVADEADRASCFATSGMPSKAAGASSKASTSGQRKTASSPAPAARRRRAMRPSRTRRCA